jgi:PBP1b-binding outer membrane lipoprotein LpoB
MRRISRVLVLSALLVGCTSTVLEYPSVCPNNEPTCQRNLNAQTLSLIGQSEAAIKLMCEDPSLEDAIGEQCTSQ